MGFPFYKKGISRNKMLNMCPDFIKCLVRFPHSRYILVNNVRCKSSSSSKQWLKRQAKDQYVKKSREENWRCRSAYKLLEIDDKYRILKPWAIVIDCGASPGSWTQVAVQRVNANREGTLIQMFITSDLILLRLWWWWRWFNEGTVQCPIKDLATRPFTHRITSGERG